MKASPARIDLQIIASPPTSSKFMKMVRINNYHIGSLNGRIQQLAEELGIAYYNFYWFALPCLNQPSPVDKNANHYFYRLTNNDFSGSIGRQILFGSFLPMKCSIFK